MALYENFVNDNEEKFVRMGRNLITLCELNKLYPKNGQKCGMQKLGYW